jgi:hypothetical protein
MEDKKWRMKEMNEIKEMKDVRWKMRDKWKMVDGKCEDDKYMYDTQWDERFMICFMIRW